MLGVRGHWIIVSSIATAADEQGPNQTKKEKGGGGTIERISFILEGSEKETRSIKWVGCCNWVNAVGWGGEPFFQKHRIDRRREDDLKRHIGRRKKLVQTGLSNVRDGFSPRNLETTRQIRRRVQEKRRQPGGMNRTGKVTLERQNVLILYHIDRRAGKSKQREKRSSREHW